MMEVFFTKAFRFVMHDLASDKANQTRTVSFEYRDFRRQRDQMSSSSSLKDTFRSCAKGCLLGFSGLSTSNYN